VFWLVTLGWGAVWGWGLARSIRRGRPGLAILCGLLLAEGAVVLVLLVHDECGSNCPAYQEPLGWAAVRVLPVAILICATVVFGRVLINRVRQPRSD
jgi:hypothetical protein